MSGEVGPVSGDQEQALTALLAARGGALHGYAVTLCRDEALARDLVQDALVGVLSRRSGADDIIKLEAYLKSAMVRRYVDLARRRRRWAQIRHLVVRRSEIESFDRGVELRLDLDRALTELSPQQRAVVIRFYYDDEPITRIAAELGCSIGSVKRYLSDARARLAMLVRDETRATEGVAGHADT